MAVALLTTSRLRLRPLHATMAPALAKAANHQEVLRWLCRLPNPYRLADAEIFIKEVQTSGALNWAIFAQEQLLGCIGIDPELGYWLGPHAWGKGYASEAVEAVIAHYFNAISSDPITAHYFLENAASAKVLEKMGFEKGEKTTQFSCARGANVLARRMSLSKSAFIQRSAMGAA